jgi:hypothetical protein
MAGFPGVRILYAAADPNSPLKLTWLTVVPTWTADVPPVMVYAVTRVVALLKVMLSNRLATAPLM